MVKINSRCFIVEVNGVQYVVKYGKIDEFLCLLLPSPVVVDVVQPAGAPTYPCANAD